jgi:uncharacterized protein YoxC
MSDLELKDVSQKIPPVMECGAAISSGKMEEFVYSFKQSARRWEIVIYPAMFAFTLLASYGFFLIYSLTSDMTQMATSMDPRMAENMGMMAENMGMMTKNVEVMSYNMTILTQQITEMNTTMHELSGKLDVMPEFLTHVEGLDGSVAQMNDSIEQMNESVILMTNNTHRMQVDIMFLSQSISGIMRPMSMFPSMMW